MTITDTDAWRDAVAGELGRRNEIAATVEGALTPDDITALAAIAGAGTVSERDVALRFLARLVRGQPARIEHVRSQLITSLRDSVTYHYFDRPLGSIAWNLFRHLVGRDADAVLLAATPVDGRSDDELRLLLRDLSLLSPASNPPVAERIAEMAQLAHPVGAEARVQLETAGLLSAAELDRIATEWRAQRDRRSLNRLYNAVIVHQRVGAPAGPIINLLGAPSLRDDTDYRWHTNEEHPIQLMILLDRNGGLESWGLR